MKTISAISMTFLILGIFQATIGCPEEDSTSKEMVKNFLSNPKLSDLRKEAGVTELNITQIKVVDNQNTCNIFNNEFGSYKDEYKITYYKVGDFYFVTQILKQPDQADEVITGLSFIYIYDKNLNFIKGYSG